MTIRPFAILFLLLAAAPAGANSFDGRYSGSLAVISSECGGQSEEFWAEVKGNTIRIYSQRAKRSFDGVISDNGRFIVGGMIATPGERLTLEWSGQISATGRVLGSLSLRSENLCQFVFSLQKN
jgi:hypothetical protein